ncbi:MAG: hypothetical protein LBQ54_13535 [Planctomycetaceae bacterium]|jgi:hypothetical protein|nr:hypothetical protein [Planctomycetaceae bacterium]
MPSEENPYAYHEPEDLPHTPFRVTDDGNTISDTEPRTPVKLLLKRKRFPLVSRLCELTVTENMFFIEETCLEPVELERESVYEVIRFCLNGFIIRVPGGRKYRFSAKKDPEKELKLARLETWCRTISHEDPVATQNRVGQNLRKWCLWPTWNNLMVVSTFGVFLFFLCLTAFANALSSINMEYYFLVTGILFLFLCGIGILLAINIASLILLFHRKTRVLRTVYLVYGILAVLNLLTIFAGNFLGIIGFVITSVIAYQASDAEKCLERQLCQLEDNKLKLQ